MFMNNKQSEIQRKFRILRYFEETGHVLKTCRYFGIGRTSFYRGRKLPPAPAGQLNHMVFEFVSFRPDCAS